jgi:hypothetical protein
MRLSLLERPLGSKGALKENLWPKLFSIAPPLRRHFVVKGRLHPQLTRVNSPSVTVTQARLLAICRALREGFALEKFHHQVVVPFCEPMS